MLTAPSIFERHGKWQVRRNCCVTGHCVYCHNRGTRGNPQPRVVQATGYSEAYARWIASQWKSYAAFAEPMPVEGASHD